MATRSLVLTLFLTLGIAGSAMAQWHADTTNTPICDLAGSQQDDPQICSDEANGAVIVWQDSRNGGAVNLYAQRIDSNGYVKWTKNGVRLCTPFGANVNQKNPHIASDGHGGAYVEWEDARFQSSILGTCLFAQHIRGDGTLAYPDTGLAIAVGKNGRSNAAIASDGVGNAYVTWEDNRTGTSASRPDIYLNRLWPGGVKFDRLTGTHGTLFKNSTTFIDTNANFTSDLINLSIDIDGKGHYLISGVPNQASLTLVGGPFNSASLLTYHINGTTGIGIDSSTANQVDPVICDDGLGGCYVAWEDAGTLPTSIYATRIDSDGNGMWNNQQGFGVNIYTAPFGTSNTVQHSKHPNIRRDGTQLIMAWETIAADENYGIDVKTDRTKGTNPNDPSMIWPNPKPTGNRVYDLYDQTTPIVFSDDSICNGKDYSAAGTLTAYVDHSPFTGADITAERVLGNTIDTIPPIHVVQEDHEQTQVRAVKINDPDDAKRNGLLAVWEDARFSDLGIGKDSTIFAQRIDRNGRKYFPNPGTTNKLGEAICLYNARQVCIAPRTDGAIVAWTDFRTSASEANIYAQLILRDGTIAFDHTPLLQAGITRTGSFDGSDCNAHCSTVILADTGVRRSGVAEMGQVSAINMKFTPATFTKGVDSAAFTVCVLDSLINGSIVLSAKDVSGNIDTFSYSYCTIPDTKAPMIKVDTTGSWLTVHFFDNRAWDRGLRKVEVSDTSNVNFAPPLTAFSLAAPSFKVNVAPNDVTKASTFKIRAIDTAGNASDWIEYDRSGPTGGVAPVTGIMPSLEVYPSPMTSEITIDLVGAKSAEVSVLDVLGREVDHFVMNRQFVWQPSHLPSGTYIIRAKVGGALNDGSALVLQTRIAKE